MTSSTATKILAFDIRARRFGFAVFEGPDKLLDWGVRSFRRGVNAVKVPASYKIMTLMSEFEPDLVVLEKAPVRENSWLLRTIIGLVREYHIPMRMVSRAAVRRRFAPRELNKYEIATFLGNRFPELAERIPPKRKPWQSEDYRMSIFDATALGLTHFASQPQNP